MSVLRRMSWRGLTIAICAAIGSLCLTARAQETAPALELGDIVVTGFSGSAADRNYPDEKTLINELGKSVRVLDIRSPGFPWDGRVWSPVEKQAIEAARVGQVFGVALDDASPPNIYLAATSYYGLYVVKPGADGKPERVLKGEADARWMPGMFGDEALGGSPGSIWKVDGGTGEVTLFANVAFEDQPNPGPGLGNITYDAAHKQLFASDLATGMVHRFDMRGVEQEVYDHGGVGRGGANLAPVAYDAAARLDITSPEFDSAQPESWGYAPPERRVMALGLHKGRLYYSVAAGGQIWSIGLEPASGRFLGDARLELEIPADAAELPVTDMVFSEKGAMILTQRGAPTSLFDYAGLAATGRSRLFRFWPEEPDDPATPGRWKPEPEEYPVGFAGDNRNGNGGVDLHYGYTEEGVLDTTVCEATVWATGDDLRFEEGLSEALAPGGPLTVDGLIALPSLPAKPVNAPPWASYIVDTLVRSPDADNTYGPNPEEQQRIDAYVEGYTGDVAVYRKPCGAGGVEVSVYSGPGYEDIATSGIWVSPPPKKKAEACLRPKGRFVCDAATGTWVYEAQLEVRDPADADTIRVTGSSPGIKVTNGPLLAIGGASTRLELAGVFKGQLMNIGLCAFEKSAADSGEPYACCKALISAYTPKDFCVKK